ncbi:MAG: carbohydrate ABC transporter permease [Microbacteriaceae bacterium]|nr:carbohydrate ABC transporter permease [Microbacteriaceae bacterium]
MTATSAAVSRAGGLRTAQRRTQKMSTRKLVVTIASTAVLLVIAVVWFAPFLILLLTSARTSADFAQLGALAFPRSFTWANFASAWKVGGFADTYRNSILITVVKVPIGVLISAMLAYALAKLKIFGRKTIMFAVFAGLTIPIYIALVPLFEITKSLGLIDNVFGLLGPYLAFGIPFEVMVLHSFFRRVPEEVFEAARIDGAGNWRIFFRVMLPLSLPALITVAILDAVSTWNEFLMALIILNSNANKTLPLGLLSFSGQFGTDYTGLAAGILIAVIPMLIAYAILQRWIVSGLTAGAVKG